MKIAETLNVDYIDAQYRAWQDNPEAVSRDWQYFFQGFEVAGRHPGAPMEGCDEASLLRQSRVDELIHRYRDIGHFLACLDPLAACPTEHPLLSLAAFDLGPEDLDRRFYTRDLAGGEQATLREIVQSLRETYCHAIGVEYMHLQDPAERRWLQERMEPERNHPDLDRDQRLRILRKLDQSALFEQFLNRKYVGVTRFSLEGGDAVIPLLDSLTARFVEQGGREIVLGMAHRGRLNVQAHILGKAYNHIFSEFESCYDPDDLVGAGDVKYHNGFLADLEAGGGRPLRIYLVNNPSHLEAVNPVVEGVARARQDLMGPTGMERVLPVLIHGDAAFAGQGVVAEVLNMSQLDGYRTGGTVHLIINNQIGYTTLPEDARSTRYSTDVAKMLMVPIFHVHGESPEAVIHTVKLAADYRAAFGKDVVIDLICYRRYGHNEGDEPYFTQPQMYDRIRQRTPLNQLYAQQLVDEGLVTSAQIEAQAAAIQQDLEADYDSVHNSACPFPEVSFFEQWEGYHGRFGSESLETGVDAQRLVSLARDLNDVPEGFALHNTLKRLLKKRLAAVEKGRGIDWANAEALAFATVVAEGHPVRLSGQDCGRGTFSQRHSVLVDTETGGQHVPLKAVEASGGVFNVYNSLLAEVGVLGFEYGYAMTRPEALVMWEAQFGDFANGAQQIIDLFIASGESKWQRLNGLVMLLPHGMEGMGPEHSSARPERFLQLCAGDNMQICNPTTPAQFFHLLRRQVIGWIRKPLVVMTPKSLLRNPLAVSAITELSSGMFSEVLDDPLSPQNATTMIFCSGKIYYELAQRREVLSQQEIALVRLEQLYPFPHIRIQEVAAAYPEVKSFLWVQEEHENMGGWRFVRPLIEAALGTVPAYVGRPEASSPATGFPAIYKHQQAQIIDTAVGPLPAAADD